MRGLMQEAAQFHEERRLKSRELIETSQDLLDTVTERQTVFSQKDLEKAVSHIEDIQVQQWLVEGALDSVNIGRLYHQNEKEMGFYITSEIRTEEERLILIADKLARSKAGSVHRGGKEWATALVKEVLLSAAKGEVTSYLFGEGQPSCSHILQGRAGTGKSHVLGVLQATITERDGHVIGLAPTHKSVSEIKAQGFDKTAIRSKGFSLNIVMGELMCQRACNLLSMRQGYSAPVPHLSL